MGTVKRNACAGKHRLTLVPPAFQCRRTLRLRCRQSVVGRLRQRTEDVHRGTKLTRHSGQRAWPCCGSCCRCARQRVSRSTGKRIPGIKRELQHNKCYIANAGFKPTSANFLGMKPLATPGGLFSCTARPTAPMQPTVAPPYSRVMLRKASCRPSSLAAAV